jgi:hypothetical protein
MTTQTVRNDGGKDQAAAQYASIVAMVERLDKANEGHDDNEQEEARDAIESDPLSVQVRSGWYTPTSLSARGNGVSDSALHWRSGGSHCWRAEFKPTRPCLA